MDGNNKESVEDKIKVMTPEEELKKIMDDLGISQVKISEILGLKYRTVVNMLREEETKHHVRDFHVEKVKTFLKDYIGNLE